jgi:hypothetical protein
MIGYHGESKPEKVAQPVKTPFFVAFDRELAETCRCTDGRILLIEYYPKNPLMLDTPGKFVEVWEDSGARAFGKWDALRAPPPGWFHPRTTRYFSEWAKQKKYDSVIIPSPAFDGEIGFRQVGGVFGDPQALILDHRIIISITDLDELEVFNVDA